MYYIITLRDRVRVPPSLFEKNLKEAIGEAIRKEYEGILDKEHGLLLSLVSIEEIGEGIIVPGDGAIYYDTVFKMLAYKPVLQEVVEGKVVQIAEFGAFVRIGPIDALVHISQIMDDYVSYTKTGSLQGRESKLVLKVGDIVRARVVAISLKKLTSAKIGLTMRQPELGKLEWIRKE